MFALCCTDETECSALPDVWLEYPNSHVIDGIANSASHLPCCQSSCISNSSCTRIDWSPTARDGQRCWLHGHWSRSQRRRSASDVTHYELRRSTVAHWVKYPDTHLYGGIATPATDLPGCQEECLNNASCTRLDWNPGSLAGRRCWIHGSWTGSRRSLQGVTHYELYRGSDGHCGKLPVYIKAAYFFIPSTSFCSLSFLFTSSYAHITSSQLPSALSPSEFVCFSFFFCF